MSDAKFNTCGAKTRQGHPCKHPAGFGTDHLGSGRCKFHGGASKGAPLKNKSAERHGFYSKHLPEESMAIVKEIEKMNPIDILWDSILIQWAAIIRAQKLMFVKNQKSQTKVLTGKTEGKVFSQTWEIQHAWDKQEQFLNAQSRAMTTLGQQLERYDKMCRSELATEEQRARINTLKARMQLLKDNALELEDLSEVDELIYGDSDG